MANDMYNTHYNLIDTLILLDKTSFNNALNVVNEILLKGDLGIDFNLEYTQTKVRYVTERIQSEYPKMNNFYAATLADCAVFAVTIGYRNEPR